MHRGDLIWNIVAHLARSPPSPTEAGTECERRVRLETLEPLRRLLDMEESDDGLAPVVLVVEDEALIRMGATDLLQEEGYEVLEAGSAAEALVTIQARPEVRVLFTDIDMPGELDGMELAERVHRRWPDVLLLVTSGRHSLSDRDVPDHGMFLSKPYAGETLSGALSELFRRHKPDRPEG